MTKQDAPPGYRLQRLNVVNAAVQRGDPWPPLLDEFQIEFNYKDDHKIEGTELWFQATLRVRAVPTKGSKSPLVTADVTLDVVFVAATDPNIDLEEFAENYAPAILFPYLRERISRLTSDLSPVAPIQLPPVNVLAYRKQLKQPPVPEKDD